MGGNHAKPLPGAGAPPVAPDYLQQLPVYPESTYNNGFGPVYTDTYNRKVYVPDRVTATALDGEDGKFDGKYYGMKIVIKPPEKWGAKPWIPPREVVPPPPGAPDFGDGGHWEVQHLRARSPKRPKTPHDPGYSQYMYGIAPPVEVPEPPPYTPPPPPPPRPVTPPRRKRHPRIHYPRFDDSSRRGPDRYQTYSDSDSYSDSGSVSSSYSDSDRGRYSGDERRMSDQYR